MSLTLESIKNISSILSTHQPINLINDAENHNGLAMDIIHTRGGLEDYKNGAKEARFSPYAMHGG